MADVARVAGVSSMTVSYVLNGTKNVQAATRAAVLAAVDQLGYAPNQAAKRLASVEATRIALAHMNQDSGYLSALLVGALGAASRCGAQFAVHRLDAVSGRAPGAALAQIVAAGADALLLPAPLGEFADADPRVRTLDAAIVAHSPGGRLQHLSAIRIDQAAAAGAMTRFLLDLGHRRVAFVSGPAHRSASRGRLAGYTAALAAAGLEPAPDLVVEGGFTFPGGLAAGDRLLDAAEPPTAIFAANDEMAAGVLAAAHRRGIDVPRQLSVVGFDDGPLAQRVWPALTTVQQPIADMADAAVDQLMADLRARRAGQVPPVVERLVDHHLIVRDSAGPPPA